MSGWYILICGATCAFGACLFLALVADEIDRAREALHLLEIRERRACERRLKNGAEAEPAVAAAA